MPLVPLDIKSDIQWWQLITLQRISRPNQHRRRRRAQQPSHSPPTCLVPWLNPFQPSELQLNIMCDFICIFMAKKNQIPTILTFLNHCQSNWLAFTARCFYDHMGVVCAHTQRCSVWCSFWTPAVAGCSTWPLILVFASIYSTSV